MQLPTEGEELRKLLDVSDNDFGRLISKYSIGRNMVVFFLSYWSGLVISNILSWYYQFHYLGYLCLIVGAFVRNKFRHQLDRISPSALQERIVSAYLAYLNITTVMLAISLVLHVVNEHYDSMYINLWLKWKQGWFF